LQRFGLSAVRQYLVSAADIGLVHDLYRGQSALLRRCSVTAIARVNWLSPRASLSNRRNQPHRKRRPADRTSRSCQYKAGAPNRSAGPARPRGMRGWTFSLRSGKNQQWPGMRQWHWVSEVNWNSRRVGSIQNCSSPGGIGCHRRDSSWPPLCSQIFGQSVSH
jgi:hypothetical protein